MHSLFVIVPADKKNGEANIHPVFSQAPVKVKDYTFDVMLPREDQTPQQYAKETILSVYSSIKSPCAFPIRALHVESLSGLPGLLERSFIKKLGIEKFLSLLEKPSEQVTIVKGISYLDRGLEEPVYFQEEIIGTLCKFDRRMQYKQGIFNLSKVNSIWPFFIPRGNIRTIAQFSRDEYYKWLRQRKQEGHYAQQLVDWLKINRK